MTEGWRGPLAVKKNMPGMHVEENNIEKKVKRNSVQKESCENNSVKENAIIQDRLQILQT